MISINELDTWEIRQTEQSEGYMIMEPDVHVVVDDRSCTANEWVIV